jgi:hypothetical protein
VEHILPKARFPELAHQWENLTNACQVCNTKKGDYFSSEEPIINPYEEDPTEHIAYHGGLPYARNGSRLGRFSIKKLALDRFQLLSERERRLRDVSEMYHAWLEATGAMKGALSEALRLDCEEGEYSSAVASFLLTLGFPLDPDAELDNSDLAAELDAAR